MADNKQTIGVALGCIPKPKDGMDARVKGVFDNSGDFGKYQASYGKKNPGAELMLIEAYMDPDLTEPGSLIFEKKISVIFLLLKSDPAAGDQEVYVEYPVAVFSNAKKAKEALELARREAPPEYDFGMTVVKLNPKRA